MKGGYGVFTVGTDRCHSNHPLSKQMAEKQKVALNISLAREHGHKIPKKND